MTRPTMEICRMLTGWLTRARFYRCCSRLTLAERLCKTISNACLIRENAELKLRASFGSAPSEKCDTGEEACGLRRGRSIGQHVAAQSSCTALYVRDVYIYSTSAPLLPAAVSPKAEGDPAYAGDLQHLVNTVSGVDAECALPIQQSADSVESTSITRKSFSSSV